MPLPILSVTELTIVAYNYRFNYCGQLIQSSTLSQTSQAPKCPVGGVGPSEGHIIYDRVGGMQK
jgi:hypothetical protein